MIRLAKLPPIFGVIIGISLYEISDTVLYLIQPLIIPTLLRTIGMLITFYYVFKATYSPLNSSISGLFRFMFIWTVFVVLRGSIIGNYIPGLPTDPFSILRRSVLNTFGAMTFFLPFIARIDINLHCLYYIKKYALFFCLLSLGMTFVAREQIAFGIGSNGLTTIIGQDDRFLTVRNLMVAAYPGFGLILLGLFCTGYFKEKIVYLFPISIFVYFISVAIGGGRGDSIFCLLYLIVYLYITRWLN